MFFKILPLQIVEKKEIFFVQVYIRAYQAAPRNPLKTQTQLKFRHKLTKAASSTSSLNKIILTQNAKNRKIQET